MENILVQLSQKENQFTVTGKSPDNYCIDLLHTKTKQNTFTKKYQYLIAYKMSIYLEYIVLTKTNQLNVMHI